MFRDGLHNRVDIYCMKHNTSNRIVKDEIELEKEPNIRNVPCRIIKGEKVLFQGAVKLSDGYKIKDLDSGIEYIIRGGNRIRGIGETHHSSYNIKEDRNRGSSL